MLWQQGGVLQHKGAGPDCLWALALLNDTSSSSVSTQQSFLLLASKKGNISPPGCDYQEVSYHHPHNISSVPSVLRCSLPVSLV